MSMLMTSAENYFVGLYVYLMFGRRMQTKTIPGLFGDEGKLRGLTRSGSGSFVKQIDEAISEHLA
ncbi:MAG: hypothetical protein DMG59_22205 [Acidobacteria bacterium]|nr:MAG: hypothetical protein DMG59_22205 [Acidobacteriota bacterium]